MKKLFSILLIVLFCSPAWAATHHVRAVADCANNGNGTTWACAASPGAAGAFDGIPASLTRGDTYYLGDGEYASREFADAVSGTSLITLKKATVADHGIVETGWDNSYGDGQANFANVVYFTTGYYVFDGNGTHTVPSNNTNDYGIKVSAENGVCLDPTPCTGQAGLIALGTGSGAITNVTVKYVHAYNAYNGNDGNVASLSIKFRDASSYIKIQNCFLENSGQDGIQISDASFVLIERTYMKKLGLTVSTGTPDVHGQAIQTFYGGDDIVIRWSVMESCQGQALWSTFGGLNRKSERLRFYGNVVYMPYGETTSSQGFNSSGGFFCDISQEGENGPQYVYIYNNTFVNNAGDYGTAAAQASGFNLYKSAGNTYIYNNLCYNCEDMLATAGDWTAYDKNASGGGDAMGGTNEQTSLASTIFSNYSGNSFRLTANTTAGATLSAEAWWSGGADAFFGTVDSNADMYGTTRSNWDRGAYEYDGEGAPAATTNTGCTISGGSIQ